MSTPLPPIDPQAADEPLPGETELAALYRQLPQNEPSPALDAAVLRAAAAALANPDDSTITDRRRGPREPGDWVHPRMATQAIPSIDAARRHRRAPRWLITLGSAASLVLVAGLAWQLRESSPPPSAPAVQGASSAVVAQASPESTPSTASPPPVLAPAAPLVEQRAAMQAAAAKKVQQSSERQSAQRQDAAKAMATVPPPPLVGQAIPAPPAAPSARPASTPPPAPPAPPAPVQEASGNAVGSVADSVADAPRADKAAAAAPVTLQEAASDKDSLQQPGDTPAQELEKIQQLFAQDHRDQALQRLRAFHQAHPQWPLSPALQAQLQEP